MDFSWTDEQRALREATIQFAEDTLNDDLVENDRTGTFSWEKWRACADFGIQGFNVPTTYGGQGKDILTTILAMEGLGFGCRENALLKP